ncbi:MAG: TonB family protein [Novosphingobium sp.]|nr:TonB family protein [Novosphingobium sp.]
MTRAELSLPPRQRIVVVAAGLVFHLLLLAFLIRAFAPGFTARVADRVNAVLMVTIATPERMPEQMRKAEGVQVATAAPGHERQPATRAAREPRIALAERPVAQASSSGEDPHAGAGGTSEGSDTGSDGLGTGTGGAGTGQGTGAGGARALEKIAGDINSTRDYPKATRELRKGGSVTIQMTVGADGRPSNCRIVVPGPDPESDRITCRLAIERFRFRPRTNAEGVAVPGEYRWRQQWWDPRD